ncbi:hypothetical protein BU17DRAFT_89779 [Hysterangium stoloniferum]|nr:hypothetical protein BU17DRAFT_89779 [Hysterangium stoloniferum]
MAPSTPSTFSSSPSSSPSLLSSLVDLISTSTLRLQTELATAGLPEPWIDRAELHPWDEESPSKGYWEARRTLISALGMLTAVVQNPREKLLCEGMGYHHPAALNFIAHTQIADILASPDVDEKVGLPIREIARRAGTHVAKTERILRFLCIYHVFQETRPNVFANTRLSTCLKKGSPNADVPLYWGDISFRSATAFSRTLRDPSTAFSESLEDAPFCKVFGGITASSTSEIDGELSGEESWSGSDTDVELEGEVGAFHLVGGKLEKDVEEAALDVKDCVDILVDAPADITSAPNFLPRDSEEDSDSASSAGETESITQGQLNDSDGAPPKAPDIIIPNDVSHDLDPPDCITSESFISNDDGTFQAIPIKGSVFSEPRQVTTAFPFLALPQCSLYRRAFAQGMVSLNIMNGALGYLDLDWKSWEGDSDEPTFVEVGASTGHLSLTVLPVVNKAKFINQDRPEVCVEGEKFFAKYNPEALTSGQVSFEPVDFFQPQPIQGAEVYILSNILHDWPDRQALDILKNIADAMTLTSRLLVMEIVLTPSISQSLNPPDENTETDANSAPWPLLKDYGIVNRYAHHQSIELITLFNGLDRTLQEYLTLFEQAGLELSRIPRSQLEQFARVSFIQQSCTHVRARDMVIEGAHAQLVVQNHHLHSINQEEFEAKLRNLAQRKKEAAQKARSAEVRAACKDALAAIEEDWLRITAEYEANVKAWEQPVPRKPKLPEALEDGVTPEEGVNDGGDID